PSMNDAQGVGKIWILALDLKQTAITGEFQEPIVKVSNQRSSRRFERTIVRVWNADVPGVRGTNTAGAADTAIEYGDLNLSQAKFEFIEHRRTESMSVVDGDLTRVAAFFAGAKSSCGDIAGYQIRAESSKRLVSKTA